MDVRLPNLGEGADSGAVVSLFVKEGDEIKKGQTILELENEKAVAPIPSPADGVVGKIRVKEGDKISVGQVLLTLGAGKGSDGKESGEADESKPARKAPAREAEAPEPEGDDGEEDEAEEAEPAVSRSGSPPPASPYLRKVARDLGIDLSRIRGSERGGRIVVGDLRKHIERLQRLAYPPKKGKDAKKPAAEPIDFSKWGPITSKPMSSLRKTISQRMHESWSAIPHVTQFDQADITSLNELRKKHAGAYEKQGARLTLTTFALRAAADVLKKHPLFNSSIDESSDEVVFKSYVHIGLAVDTEAGLIVPVIRDVDKKSLTDLSREVSQLAEKARDRKIGLEDLKGGSFTISNQGGIGGGHFTPIVNRPEVAILGMGRGATQARVLKDGKIEPRLMLPLAVSYDHRLIDGGQAARFVTDLVQAFESFSDADVAIK